MEGWEEVVKSEKKIGEEKMVGEGISGGRGRGVCVCVCVSV